MLHVALSLVILKHIEDLAVIMKMTKKYLCVSKLSDRATGKEEKPATFFFGISRLVENRRTGVSSLLPDILPLVNSLAPKCISSS